MNAANLIDHIASITSVTGAPGIAIALCYLIYTIKQDRLHAENRAFFLFTRQPTTTLQPPPMRLPTIHRSDSPGPGPVATYSW